MKIKVEHDPFHPELQDCPIGCHRPSRTIIINPVLFDQLTPFEQKFWIGHEMGHIVLDTDSETEADTYAFNRMAGTEYRSLKQMVQALNNLLDPAHSETAERKRNLLKIARKWDETH